MGEGEGDSGRRLVPTKLGEKWGREGGREGKGMREGGGGGGRGEEGEEG